jgi:hypothetical protein
VDSSTLARIQRSIRLARAGAAACVAAAVTLATQAGAGVAAAGTVAGAPVHDPSTRSLVVAVATSVMVMLAGVALIVTQHRLASGTYRRELARRSAPQAGRHAAPAGGDAVRHLARVVASVEDGYAPSLAVDGYAPSFGVMVDAPARAGADRRHLCVTCGQPR